MGLNRKTNWWGILGLIFGIGKVVLDIHNGHPLDLSAIATVAASSSLGLGLTQAKDNNVTGVGVNAEKIHSNGVVEKAKL
jgi:hypothetical protein